MDAIMEERIGAIQVEDEPSPHDWPKYRVELLFRYPENHAHRSGLRAVA